MEHKLMSEQEKINIFMEAHKLRKEGKEEEAAAVQRKAPLPAFLAKTLKENFGAKILVQGGWNLAEANAEYGSDWLNN